MTRTGTPAPTRKYLVNFRDASGTVQQGIAYVRPDAIGAQVTFRGIPRYVHASQILLVTESSR